MSAFTGNIINTSSSVYTVSNGTGMTDQLVIRELTGNIIASYEYTDIDTIEVLNSESYELTVPQGSIYSVYWVSDNEDIATIVNSDNVDECILKMTSDILCCDTCGDCQDLCNDMNKVKTFIMVSMLYETFMDLIEIHFGTPQTWYAFAIDEINELYAMKTILDKISMMCSCTKC